MSKLITDVSLEKLAADEKALVWFTAVWCQPCKRLAPHMEKASDQIEASVYKVDADEHEDIIQRYDIRSVPTLLVLRRGEVVATIEERTALKIINAINQA